MTVGGSLKALQSAGLEWERLLSYVGRTIAVMPLWKLQTVGREQKAFLYPIVGSGRVIRLRRVAVYCLRQFHTLIGDLVQTAWVRFVQRLPSNQERLGRIRDLRDFLFGSDRVALERFGHLLREHQHNQCFYCKGPLAVVLAVDHFIPWSRYQLDLGHNFVAAHAACNGNKSDRLASVDHLARWTHRNADSARLKEFDRMALPHDLSATTTWRARVGW
jgi:5-methylcytosine-specific restriction endonuclease McrA